MVPRKDDIKVTFIAANTFGINTPQNDTPMNKEIDVFFMRAWCRESMCVCYEWLGPPILASSLLVSMPFVLSSPCIFAMIFSCWLPWILGFPSAFRPSDGHPLISSLAILSPFQLAAMFRPCCPSISGRSFSSAFHGSST